MLFQNGLTLSAHSILKNVSNVSVHTMKVKQFKTLLPSTEVNSDSRLYRFPASGLLEQERNNEKLLILPVLFLSVCISESVSYLYKCFPGAFRPVLPDFTFL